MPPDHGCAGRYQAEESFLKINKSGRQLSQWETTLVENRQSSFARAVMSIAHITEAQHCWPTTDPEIRDNTQGQQQIREILDTVRDLHQLLFTPVYETPIKQPQQPVLATPYTRPELKPAYLAELLTITEGNKGQPPETRRLLQRDAKAKVPMMIAQGWQLLRNARDVIDNIAGLSPRSLSLMPLVYFYNTNGTFVRSLLYGMIYWLNRGSASDILTRKHLFSAHRGAFEEVLLGQKDQIIGRIARRIGSGPEVTYQTAMYYDGLLTLLIKHRDRIAEDAFKQGHERLVETLSPDDRSVEIPEIVSASRNFRGRTRANVVVPNFIRMFQTCEVCGGRFYPNNATQVDHVVMHAHGGQTVPSNGRELHPFCNNQREVIEDIRADRRTEKLPTFDDPRKMPKAQQLSFLEMFTDDMPMDDQFDSQDAEMEDENEEE